MTSKKTLDSALGVMRGYKGFLDGLWNTLNLRVSFVVMFLPLVVLVVLWNPA